MDSKKSEYYLVHVIKGLGRPTKKRIISYIVIVVAIVILATIVPMNVYNQLFSNLSEFLKDPSVFVALMVGSGSIIVGMITFRFQNKQLKLNGLVEAFKLLNDPRHREAKANLYSYFAVFKKSGYKNLYIFSTDRQRQEDVEMVRADFDQMGMLVKKGAIYKNEFLEAYGYNAYVLGNA